MEKFVSDGVIRIEKKIMLFLPKYEQSQLHTEKKNSENVTKVRHILLFVFILIQRYWGDIKEYKFLATLIMTIGILILKYQHIKIVKQQHK